MLVASLILLLLGSALATRGLIGRRVGNEPRCRKCKYNLTGVESKECPECGRPWTSDSAARGLRHRRKIPLILGLVMLPAGSVLLAPGIRTKLQTTNFFQYMPNSIVLPAAARGSSDAFDVIAARMNTGEISPSQLQDVIAVALEVQNAPTQSPHVRRWVKLLTKLYWQSALSKMQQNRYFTQMVRLDLETPPPIMMTPTGRCTIPVLLWTDFRCDSETGHVWRAYVDVSLDSGEFLMHRQFVSDMVLNEDVRSLGRTIGLPPGGYVEVALRDLRAGVRRLIVNVDAQIFTTETSPIPLRWSGTSTLSAQIELVPDEAPHPNP